jgi:hypothetical protein
MIDIPGCNEQTNFKFGQVEIWCCWLFFVKCQKITMGHNRGHCAAAVCLKELLRVEYLLSMLTCTLSQFYYGTKMSEGDNQDDDS